MRLSLQLYTLRDDLSRDLIATLDAVRDIGLKYVEFAGYYGLLALEWRDLLDERGLSVSAAHIGIDQIEHHLDTVIGDCKTLGCKYVVIPWLGEDAYADGWDTFGKTLIPYAEELKAEGLQLAYHNHAFEFKTDGLNALYGAVSPDLLKAQLDLAWVHIGGADPVEYVHRFANRTPLVHLKDYDPSKTPQWQPAGKGILDMPAIIAACKEIGVEFGSIELDESPGAPLDAVRESFAYLVAQGLA